MRNRLSLVAFTACCVDYYPQIERSLVGGNSLNVAAMWKRLEPLAKVSVITLLGKDVQGEMIHDFFSRAGIDTSRVYQEDGATASNQLRVDTDGERSGIEGSWRGGLYEDFLLLDQDWEWIARQDMVAIPANNPNFSSMIQRHQGKQVLSVDYLDMENNIPVEPSIGHTDMAFIAGHPDHLPGLKELAFSSNKLLVVTSGAQGSYAYHEGIEYFQPAIPVPEVIDTTGCGDAYQAAFALNYLKTGQVEESMKAGAAAASQVASVWGGVASLMS